MPIVVLNRYAYISCLLHLAFLIKFGSFTLNIQTESPVEVSTLSSWVLPYPSIQLLALAFSCSLSSNDIRFVNILSPLVNSASLAVGLL